jgi:hypothetical protein
LFSEDFLSEMIENLINLLIKNFNDLNPSDTIYFAEFDEEKFNKEEFRKLLLHDISSIKLSQNLFNKKELKEQIQRDLEEYEKTKKDPEKQKQLKKIIKSDTEAFNKLNYIYSRKLYLFENLFFRLYPLVKDHINIKNKIKIALLTQNVEMASIFLGIYNFNEKKCFLDFDEILIKCIQYKVSISIKFIESYLEILSFF